MKELQQRYPIDLHWRSYELRPAGSPPIPPEYRARIEQGRAVFAQRLKDDHGLTLNSGPFGINSRPALIVDKYAHAQAKGAAFHAAVERAYWLEARDISQHEVLKEMLEQVGLGVADLSVIFTNSRYELAVNQDIMEAAQLGLRGVPALVFEQQYLISGAQPLDVLQEVTEKLLQRRGQSS